MRSASPFQRILLTRCDNLGDVVMLSPAVKAIREAYPDAQLTLLTSPAGSSIAGLLPWLDEVLVERVLWQDASGALSFDPERERALILKLQERHFDAAFIFTSFSQTPHAAAYASYLADIPVRVGHSKEFGGAVLSHAFASPPDGLHQTERNLRLLERFGIPVSDRHLRLEVPPPVEEHTEALLARHGISHFEPYIALVPGASCEARRYPPQRFGEVARLLVQRSDLPVIAMGSEKERDTLREAANESTISLMGETNPMEYASLLSRASVVIANNSSALHIADAFDRPLVATYSGTDLIDQWTPRYSRARILQQPTHCSPCYGFNCRFNLECLDLKPTAVAGAALDLLRDSKVAAA